MNIKTVGTLTITGAGRTFSMPVSEFSVVFPSDGPTRVRFRHKYWEISYDYTSEEEELRKFLDHYDPPVAYRFDFVPASSEMTKFTCSLRRESLLDLDLDRGTYEFEPLRTGHIWWDENGMKMIENDPTN